jgi:hypothetical protein
MSTVGLGLCGTCKKDGIKPCGHFSCDDCKYDGSENCNEDVCVDFYGITECYWYEEEYE